MNDSDLPPLQIKCAVCNARIPAWTIMLTSVDYGVAWGGISLRIIEDVVNLCSEDCLAKYLRRPTTAMHVSAGAASRRVRDGGT
jgi:hypothetical protein